MIGRLAVGIVTAWAGAAFAQAPPGAGGGPPPAPSVKAGPVQLTATRSTVQRAVVFGPEVRHVSTTTLLLRIAPDPNSVVAFVSDFKVDALTDQAGRPLKAALRANQFLSLTNNQLILPVE